MKQFNTCRFITTETRTKGEPISIAQIPGSFGWIGSGWFGCRVLDRLFKCQITAATKNGLLCDILLFGPWPYTNIFLSLSLHIRTVSFVGMMPLTAVSLAAKGGAPSLHAFVSLSYLRNLWGYLGFFFKSHLRFLSLPLNREYCKEMRCCGGGEEGVEVLLFVLA